MNRILCVDDHVVERCNRLREFAEQPINWYQPEEHPERIPGEDIRYTLDLNDYHVVFSITQARDGIWRHLSISVPDDGSGANYPSPAASFTIADLMGFTGAAKNSAGVVIANGPLWQILLHQEQRCVILAEPYTMLPADIRQVC